MMFEYMRTFQIYRKSGISCHFVPYCPSQRQNIRGPIPSPPHSNMSSHFNDTKSLTHLSSLHNLLSRRIGGRWWSWRGVEA